MKKLILTIAMMSSVAFAIAQSRVVTGSVVDGKGDGLPGAQVMVKGTTLGVVTDDDGNFSIEVPEGSTYLIVSSFGTDPVEIKLGAQSEYKVSIKEEVGVQDLEGVAVYGQKLDKRSYTGSLNSVSSKEIANRPVTSVGAALDGAAPGLATTSTSGQPGSNPDIMLRGQGSLSASSAPLIVLDGAPYSGSLNTINPLDIKDLVVLKDATAKAVYGARAANGVILITTKRGENMDKPRISVDASVGVLNRYIPEYDIIDNVRDYYEAAWKGYILTQNRASTPSDKTSEAFVNFLGGYNAYRVPASGLIDDNPTSPTYGKVLPGDDQQIYNDSWAKEIQRVGVRQNYNVSVMNGNATSDYYLSIGYTKDQGIIKNSEYSRITGMLNVNTKVTDWLKTGLKMQAAFDDQQFFLATSSSSALSNPLSTPRMMGPIYPVYRYNLDGTRMLDEDGNPLYDFGNNASGIHGTTEKRPVAMNSNAVASLFHNKPYTIALTGNVTGYMEAQIYRDLTARGTIAVNYYDGNELNYYSSLYGDAANVSGRSSRGHTNQIDYTFNQFLTWKPQFGNVNHPIFDSIVHSFQLTLGHENYFLKNNNLYATRIGFSTAFPDLFELTNGANGEGSGSSEDNLRIETYFAQAEYNFKRKYYLSGSVSRNGSSRFSPQARWGTFGSAGAGWIISDEDFASSWRKHVDMVKLRFSWGTSGNDAINGLYSWMDRFASLNNADQSGLIFANYGNLDLKWEGSVDMNLGVDVATKKDRVTASLDVYNRGSDNLLFLQPLANSVGTTGFYANVGSMRNRGIELSVGARVFEKKTINSLTWYTKLNLSHNRNAVTQVQGKDSLIGGGGTILAKGLPVNSFYMYEYAGVDTSGNPTWRKADGTVVDKANQLDPRVDKKVFGSSFRDLEGSWSNTINYRNLELNFVATFGLGGKYYDGVYAGLTSATNQSRGQAIHKDVINNSWQKRGDETKEGILPAFTYLDGNADWALSNMNLISNSYFRIRNVNLAYNLPNKMLSRAKIPYAKVYFAMDNVFNLSARKGVDVTSAFFGAGSFNYYPYRTFMLGVSMGL
ncbi:MAG TPA: SusC/RagA family TonB-linked outer membrane protein [Edaphocola sp.]|nr:SusC/RagA family TonB-linked outer membrane protein [Edaphocola sp.]